MMRNFHLQNLQLPGLGYVLFYFNLFFQAYFVPTIGLLFLFQIDKTFDDFRALLISRSHFLLKLSFCAWTSIFILITINQIYVF